MAIKEYFREHLIKTVTTFHIRVTFPLGIDIIDSPIGPTMSQFGMVASDFFDEINEVFDDVVLTEDVEDKAEINIISKEDDLNNLLNFENYIIKEFMKLSIILSNDGFFLFINLNLYLENLNIFIKNFSNNFESLDKLKVSLNKTLIKPDKAFFMTAIIKRINATSTFRTVFLKGPSLTGLLSMGFFNRNIYKKYLKTIWDIDIQQNFNSFLGYGGLVIFLEEFCSIASIQFELERLSQVSYNFFGICRSILSTAFTLKVSIIFWF